MSEISLAQQKFLLAQKKNTDARSPQAIWKNNYS